MPETSETHISLIDAILQSYEQYVDSHGAGIRPAAPARRVAVVTCMDARIEPFGMLGLHLGDAHVIRNAGGRMIEALRSLIISQEYLDTEAVMLIHHTGCGMLSFHDADLRQKLRDRGANADHVAFLPVTDLEQAIRDDLQIYRDSPLVRQDVEVRGFIYDVENGRLTEVLAEAD